VIKKYDIKQKYVFMAARVSGIHFLSDPQIFSKNISLNALQNPDIETLKFLLEGVLQ
jgi:hypothetical protein